MEKRKEEIMKFVFCWRRVPHRYSSYDLSVFVANGLPTIGKIGVADFLRRRWRPANDVYGILPTFDPGRLCTLRWERSSLSSGRDFDGCLYGVSCPEKIYNVLKPSVELLAGIPSVVYGFRPVVMHPVYP